MAKLAQDYSSHLSVTSFELPLFGPCGTEIFRVARPAPCAGGLQRAFLASRAPRSTDHCAELHDRFCGLHLSRGLLGFQNGPESSPISGYSRRPSLTLTLDNSSHNPSHVGINDGLGNPKGESSNRSGGVITNSRKAEQNIEIRGDLTAVLRCYLASCLVQTERSPRVAETPPGNDGVRPGRAREVGRGWPALHPLMPYRLNPRHRCLLKHDL